MPPTTRETIPCPQCGQSTDVDLWQVLDLAREPDLRCRPQSNNRDPRSAYFLDSLKFDAATYSS